MKFLVPHYSFLQNPWQGGYRPQIPVLSVLNWICWNPPEQSSWVRHCTVLTVPLYLLELLRRICVIGVTAAFSYLKFTNCLVLVMETHCFLLGRKSVSFMEYLDQCFANDVPRKHVYLLSSLRICGLVFLGAFTKLRKSDYWRPLVSLSVRVEQLGSHWTDLHEILYLGIFRKSVEKIQVWLKSCNSGYVTWRHACVHSRQYLAEFFLEWEMFQAKKKSCTENVNTFYVP